MFVPFSSVVGQESALAQLHSAVSKPVHAYLFVGPAGVGKRAAALDFAALLLDDERAHNETHPDLIIVEREGASISLPQAREISRLAVRSPVEGSRKVLVLNDFHLVADAGPALLKTIEEASASTVFVILAEYVPKELITVASRCLRIDFRSIPNELIESTLVADGIPAERAKEAADASFGNLDRARLLAIDDDMAMRRNLWKESLSRLDGTGNAVTTLVDGLLAAIDHASAPLLARQEQEAAATAERVKNGGGTKALLKPLEAKQKRELRRLRTDELRAGLATIAQELSSRYIDVSNVQKANSLDVALDALQWANESLNYNPNETWLLNGLFVRLTEASVTA